MLCQKKRWSKVTDVIKNRELVFLLMAFYWNNVMWFFLKTMYIVFYFYMGKINCFKCVHKHFRGILFIFLHCNFELCWATPSNIVNWFFFTLIMQKCNTFTTKSHQLLISSSSSSLFIITPWDISALLTP